VLVPSGGGAGRPGVAGADPGGGAAAGRGVAAAARAQVPGRPADLPAGGAVTVAGGGSARCRLPARSPSKVAVHPLLRAYYSFTLVRCATVTRYRAHQRGIGE